MPIRVYWVLRKSSSPNELIDNKFSLEDARMSCDLIYILDGRHFTSVYMEVSRAGKMVARGTDQCCHHV